MPLTAWHFAAVSQSLFLPDAATDDHYLIGLNGLLITVKPA
jgi:hypothetical protein